MTIAALLRLLDEIDRQGGPDAARKNTLRLTDDEGAIEPMTAIHTEPQLPPLVTVRPPDADADPERLPVGQLLAWGDQHDDPEIQDQAARARIALAGLRQRYAADQELTAIATEAEQLEKRLAELRAREQELAPAKPKKRTAARDYDTREVRAWATATGVDCPRVGQIPKRVLDAWRAAHPQPAVRP
ncbi:Lsr2 family DNA-binding protein [Streptomyces achromogenes]|uniref:Lsr2 family DNA-binding protein n=1 Tax=Streptomyces achromogenes TaxID=67255 RepID=UPI003673D889